MLKKLRIKFIALNMATAAVVLVAVFSAICVISYQQSLQSVYAALDTAMQHADGGSLAHGQLGALEELPGSALGEKPADEQPPLSLAPQDENGSGTEFAPPEIGGQQGGTGQSIPVAVYRLNEGAFSTAAISLSTATIASDVLARAASQLTTLQDGTGLLDDLGLYYEKRTLGTTTYVAFADMSATSQWHSLALALTGVGLAALAVFFVISLFFSRWALRPVSQAWSQQQRFVADASHDLKTPLTVILANTSILMEHPERSIASQSQWVESTQNEAEHMQELVEDLLLLAQLDEKEAARGAAKSATANFERVDLSDLVEGELLEFESIAYERGIALSQDLAAGVAVQGNTTRLRRLAATLIDNACKYVDAGGSVSVSLHANGKHAQLSVHNTGAPIAPKDLPHVFDRFYRADKARTRTESGHGLGLAIARAIAEEHNGTLTATSTEQAGTTFTATIPLEQ